MKIVKFRVVGHPRHKDTEWRPVGHGLTLLDFGNEALAADILLALQSLSPPYDIGAVQPFNAFPQYISTGSTTKKIIPAKKTAAFVVLSNTVPLVMQLAAIDPDLYELDRTELGRRRDLSLWSNFVEIASSSRWSEIRPMVEKLLSTAASRQTGTPLSRCAEYCTALKDTDRIKGEVARKLESRLTALGPHLGSSQHKLVEQALYCVHRHDRFMVARKTMLQHLPLFLFLSSHHLIQQRFEVAKITGSSVANGKTEPLGYLLTELYQSHAPEDDLGLFVDRVNTAINDHLPEQDALPQFILEGNYLHLRLATSGQYREMEDLPPIHGFIAIVQTAIALHLSLKQVKPVIFLYPHGLAKTTEENNSLLHMLSHMFRKDQALLVASSGLLSAYRKGDTRKRVRSMGLD